MNGVVRVADGAYLVGPGAVSGVELAHARRRMLDAVNAAGRDPGNARLAAAAREAEDAYERLAGMQWGGRR